MMELSPLDQVGIRLRDAIGRGEYEVAQGCLAAYCRQVEETLANGAGDANRISLLASETSRMFEWAHRSASAARAQAASDLQSLRSKLSYTETRPPGVRTWEIEG